MSDDSLHLEEELTFYRDVSTCASCAARNLFEVCDFGDVPLAGYFPRSGSEDAQYLLPMKLLICTDCSLIQISPDVSDEVLFSDYRYVSSVGMQEHFNRFTEWFVEEIHPNTCAKILEIGCNDGPLLHSLTQKGFTPKGIDPATNIAKLAREKNLEVIIDFFNESILDKYNLRANQDIIISCNSFAHISDISGVAKAVSKALNANGTFILEVQSVFEMVKNNAFDFVYHEHKYYYSLKSIEYLLHQFGLNLFDGMKIDTHGGSYRLVFSKSRFEKTERLKIMEWEEARDSLTPQNLTLSIEKFMQQIELMGAFLRRSKVEGIQVVGFGASGRANMLLHYLGDDASILESIYDNSLERIGRNMGFTKIPIRSFLEMSGNHFDAVVILAWNYVQTMITKLPETTKKIVIPLPSYRETEL